MKSSLHFIKIESKMNQIPFLTTLNYLNYTGSQRYDKSHQSLT